MTVEADEWLGRVETPDGSCVVLKRDGCVSVALVDSVAFSDLPELIEQIEGNWERITPGETVEISEDAFLACVGHPRKVLCIGLNYLAHAEESSNTLPTYPMVFAKWASTLTGPFDDILLPPESEKVDWEAELAVVIGKTCRRVSPAEVESVIFGYSIANDVSMRDWQRHTSQIGAGKGWDQATPLGPIVVQPRALGGVTPDVAIEGRLNGEIMQRARTSQLVHDVPAVVQYITTWTTLQPGDVILTGTCSGVGMAMNPERFLEDGDVYEVAIEGIGSLANTFRRDRVN
jgi:acylpyruvate hydrolase